MPAPVRIALCLAAAATLTPMVAAQNATPLPSRSEEVRLSFTPVYEHAFEVDLEDRNGEMEYDLIGGTFAAQATLAPRWSVSASLRYTFESFDFSPGDAPGGGFGGFNTGDGPWDDIHTLQLGARFKHEIDNRWNLYFGPILRFARESDADFGDGAEGGGFAAVSYDLSDNLTFGLGGGAISQIEDDPRFFPIVILNYRFGNGDFALGSSTGSNRSGLELIYSGFEDVELAAGIGFTHRRFRLDDDGIAPDGVGQITGNPVWARLAWKPRHDLSLGVIGGVILDGELRLEDEDGDTIASPDVDNQPFIGLNLRISF